MHLQIGEAVHAPDNMKHERKKKRHRDKSRRIKFSKIPYTEEKTNKNGESEIQKLQVLEISTRRPAFLFCHVDMFQKEDRRTPCGALSSHLIGQPSFNR
jgi:hypothetical protein